MFENKKALVGIILLAIIVVVLGVLFLKNKPSSGPGGSAYQTPVEVEKDLMDGTKAHDLALPIAQTWQPDAVLAYMKSDEVGQVKGRSAIWTLTFTSAKAKKGTGYQVEVKNFQVISQKEVPYASSTQSAPLPEGIITQEQAVAQVRAIPGYENVEILKVDLVYGAGDKQWYWGVETSKGTVSVEAKKK